MRNTNISDILIQDYEYIRTCPSIDWSKFAEKTFLITGATGLIGQNIIKSVHYVSTKEKLGIRIIALVRNTERAKQLFSEIASKNDISILYSDVTDISKIEADVDYIIHGASPTDSQYFVSHPVETIKTAVSGTQNLLNIAREKRVSGMIYLSSMEVYGHPERGHSVSEDAVAGFDTTVSRNSYPISKQVCESLCAGAASEYAIPVMCARLTQTFGPGVCYDDNRIFAEFMRSVVTGKDIILKTKGETERCYLYTADCVTAIMTLLQKGTPGQCYNIANPETYCSIYDMAQLVAERVSDNQIKVTIQLEDISRFGYANTLYMDLNISKMNQLGWKPFYNLERMFSNMIETCLNQRS